MPVETSPFTPAQQARLDEIHVAATAAEDKPAALGPDLDLTAFKTAPEQERVASIEEIQKQYREVALLSGFTSDEKDRSASFFQLDRTPIYQKVMEAFEGQVEIMGTAEALLKYPEEMIEKYWWRAVDPAKDKYTAIVALHQTEGYFIRVKAGAKVEKAIQACLFISESQITQNLHNVIIVEEGAEATVITGCNIHTGVKEGLHAGISEFYVHKGAKLTFTMVHNWAEEFSVRPRTAVVCDDDATYINNYVLLKPVRSIQAYPIAKLVGRNSRAVFNTIVYGQKDSYIDLGSETQLIGEGSRGEAIARTVTKDNAVVYSRGRLIAETNDCKAHLDCRGFLNSEGSSQYAIPELVSHGAPRAELSHEAAISPIAEEEVFYLMARGVPRDEAVSMITRGFLDLEILGLPGPLKRAVDKVLAETAAESM